MPRTALFVPISESYGPVLERLEDETITHMTKTSHTRDMMTGTELTETEVRRDNWRKGEALTYTFQEFTGRAIFRERNIGQAELTPAELAAKPKGLPTPVLPTKEEIELHELTHLPYRSWCDVCVRSRGKQDPPTDLDKIANLLSR